MWATWANLGPRQGQTCAQIGPTSANNHNNNSNNNNKKKTGRQRQPPPQQQQPRAKTGANLRPNRANIGQQQQQPKKRRRRPRQQQQQRAQIWPTSANNNNNDDDDDDEDDDDDDDDDDDGADDDDDNNNHRFFGLELCGCVCLCDGSPDYGCVALARAVSPLHWGGCYTGMPQVPVPVLHREGLLGPPPTQLDLVVDLAWCEVRTVAVTCTEFDRFVRPRTERLFF